jgi:ethylmalonyl-CoA/methylmalonyl-CoA decarboxylase
MMCDLRDAVSRIAGCSTLSAVLLTGSAGAFCSGGDLTAVRAHLMAPGAGAGMCAYMTETLDRLAALPVVVVAAVEGAALGGGAELLTCADIVVAGSSARIGFVHASLGVSPGWGGGRRLVGRVGARVALRLLAFSPRLSAEQARSVGLVDEVVADGAALGRAEDIARPLASMPVDAVRAAVSVTRGADEAACFTALWGGASHQEALRRVTVGKR